MCGICGILAWDGAPVSAERIERMAAVLRHRGPDDAGVHVERAGGVAIGLGHRRLSIIDLSSAGHQPMTNEDGTIWLTYNGEIYNHREARAELLARGHRYHSETDSETIVHGFEEWGEAAVERFRGMFAFGLWDRANERLWLGRDRLGVKPLYYAVAGGALVFASEIKGILASGLVEPTPAAGAIPEYLTFGYLAGDGTLFRGIRKLPPGHLLRWERGRIEVKPYWTLKFTHAGALSEPESVEQFRHLLEESVRLRLMSDVPLGVFLSGGLDSSAIAAVMSRQVAGRLKTFSVGFEARHYSEFPFAREVAQYIGADHHEVVLTPDAFLASLPRMIWYEDEPLWGAPSVALYHVAELASKSVKVVLTGEGSDELFGGYDRYWMTAWNARLAPAWRALPAAVRNVCRRALLDGPLPRGLRRKLGHTFVNHETWPDGLFFDNWLGVFPPSVQRRLCTRRLLRELEGADVYATHRRLLEESGATDLVGQLLYADVRSNMVELLMKQDQMSMAASIESRVPFLDHKLVEFAGRVPARFKIRGRAGKHLVKQALRGYLPDSILFRPKQGFPVPFNAWLRERFLGQAASLLLDATATGRDWFRPEAVRALLEAHAAGSADNTRQIWNLWGLELWARIFLDGDRAWVDSPTEVWSAVAGRTALVGALKAVW